MTSKAKLWIIGYLIISSACLSLIAYHVIKVDPFFHYHKPDTEHFYYSINNQRSQNNGIVKQFDYEGLITGTSMTEMFKTSEASDLWGCEFIKVPYSGGTYKEMNGNIKTALSHNTDLRYVIRGIDMGYLRLDKDYMRDDLGSFPTYLYDDNPFNDVQYVFNRDVIFNRVYPMLRDSHKENAIVGIKSFDDYSRWTGRIVYGKDSLLPNVELSITKGEPQHLAEDEKVTTRENIVQNVTSIAADYPAVQFYYFLTPYSAIWWKEKVESGEIYKQIEAEKILIEECMKHSNIHLVSINLREDITCNLNNYKDRTHYGEWINSYILRCMHDDQHVITEDNYQEYLDNEMKLYLSYDYTKLEDQIDYENDLLQAALMAETTYHQVPRKIDFSNPVIEYNQCEILENQHDGQPGALCTGKISRDYRQGSLIREFLRDYEYVGFKIPIDDYSVIHYIVFYGKKIEDHGQPTVYVYNSDGEAVAECRSRFDVLDNEWHEYLIDVSSVKGSGFIIFNGGYVDSSGYSKSQYVFSDIKFY